MVNNRRRESLERIIMSCIEETTEVWVGEWVGYVWMDEPDSGYHHVAFNHNVGQVSDQHGRGGNPAEGLWM